MPITKLTNMKTIIGTEATPERMFDIIDGWTSQFEINGKKVGGTVDLYNDPRLQWQIDNLPMIKGMHILELGPLEGAHTLAMYKRGVSSVTAIEGVSDCFLRCLIVQQAFPALTEALFVFADFNKYIEMFLHEDMGTFDVVCANGVLYHQENPAELIYNLAKITDNVMVWSQVASEDKPSKVFVGCENKNGSYQGKLNTYGELMQGYCGGLSKEAIWLYPNEMLRCFKDAGFTKIIQKEVEPTVNGDAIMFVASK